ncbi:S1C family serine protease [Microbacterium luticocti]|uniref:S1C family serine protease n=1 Tax=Microbacterium luticocti TaxID=451764 RepID=UPI0004241EE1|nr:trypsin-like peptidase domain-containing protein [Microbacterium luticocti]
MSENQDLRPENIPAAPAAPDAAPAQPVTPVPDAAATQSSPAAPAAGSQDAAAPADRSVSGQQPASTPSTPAAPAVPAQPVPTASTSAAPASPAQPAAPAATPASPAPAAHAGTGAPAAAAAATPGAPQTHPTLPYPGAGFGVPPQPTAPTQPVPPIAGNGSGFAAAGAATAATGQKKSGAGKIAGLLVAAAIVGGAAGIGGAWAGSALWGPVDGSSASSPSVVTVNNPDSVNATTAIAAKVVPSVVTIDVSSGSGTGGTGSGVILSKDGYVLTNTHVVTLDGETGHPTISVTTSDGHIYQARIVGTDPVYDLAVIKLEGASDLTPITWGEADKLNVGDQTVAIGAPLGLSNTVTTGIVSALNRSIEISSSAAPEGSGGDEGDGGQNGESPFFFDFGQQQQSPQTKESIKIAVIQTDAPINPGNSGGALVDAQGRLVGINVAIASTGSSSSGQSGSIGVGFAIPSDVAHRVAEEIIKDGKATHGLLGATVRDAAAVQGATITGAEIADVTADGAAAKAGLRQGDIVTAFNGTPISGAVDLTAQVRAAAAGSKATVTYVRDGATHTVDVTLGTLK